ncbi:MAG: glycogen/starch/alpha-glucan family phosphorylase, partial [Chitinivibrionales bacterium]
YIVNHTFAYTNHTLMPEALEKWGVSLLGTLLPRHLEIIFEINRKFLEDVARKFPGDNDRLRRMSLIEEGGEKKVRMAFLSIIGSFSVNGVADLHTKLLERGLFKDFYELCPEKFNNKTNGITPRRWLYKCNEQLSSLISSKIGDSWTSDLSKISEISKYSKDKGFIGEWRKAKNERKVIMRDYLKRLYGFDFNPDSMYNIMVKRIHEYKRQLLKAFHCIHIYLRLKQGETDFVPRTVFIAGKAAPGYSMAKLIIKFINNVSNIINNDHETNNVLKLFFIPNYRVSLAESLMPAADLSEHISTAGTEASGTSNMKFALNGALTIGTMDGANIEMMNEIGRENMFVFGNNSDQVEELRNSGYSPSEYIQRSEDLRRIISLVENNFFSLNESDIFKPILDEIRYNDRFMVCADFDAYIKAQQEAEKVFSDKEEWDKRSVLNTAGSGKFSSDRTIEEYNRDIWGVDSIQVDL